MRRTERLSAAARIVREAATAIRTSTRPLRVRLKASVADIQTSTDRQVERLIRRRLAAYFPGEAIVGEEGDGLVPFDQDRPTWFVDPVDGTTNYYRGIPLVACNLAFWDGERLDTAVVADVANRRLYLASAGRGAWCGRRRLTVGGERLLERAVVSTGFPSDRMRNADNNLAEFADLVLRVRDVRRIGVAGLDLGYVSAGMLDAYWERGDGPWDWAAGALLVREAGGVATTWDGRLWRPGDDTMVASNGLVHDAMLARLAAVRGTVGPAGPAEPPASVLAAGPAGLLGTR